ncbi:MAG: hypothetical protein IJO11_07745 [Alphaproteobacteria bacterium]|nr:hypothetical protein [Alphaproteobacteria bacterium]MBQ8557797.1 hypothetical protein [Alphaproteobacteria bacterium]
MADVDTNDTITEQLSGDEFLAPQGIDFREELKVLEKERNGLLYRKEVADRFSQTAQKRIAELDEHILLIRQFIGEDDVYSIKPLSAELDDNDIVRLAMHPKKGDTIRRGALTAKQKEILAQEAEEKREKEQSANMGQKPDKSQPKQPPKAGEPIQPEQPLLPPEIRKELIKQQLSQKDPRKQKKGLEELKKPENKDLGKDDPQFKKLKENAEKRVKRFEKIREDLRKSLRRLLQSDSMVVKKNLDALTAGRIGAGVAGFKEIAQTTDPRANDVAFAAGNLVKDVMALYKEFDIKPAEALSREAIKDAQPTITRKTGYKTEDDRRIDRNSTQNRYLGQSNELSAQEREEYKKVKMLYGVDVDKLPPTDVETNHSMEIVRSIVQETASNPHGQLNTTMLAAQGKGSR